MDDIRGSSPEDDVATECQQLLSPPIAHRATGHQQNLTMSSAKLGASALNFFLSGIAMVAVGVCGR
jgi:hypothetical protein